MFTRKIQRMHKARIRTIAQRVDPPCGDRNTRITSSDPIRFPKQARAARRPIREESRITRVAVTMGPAPLRPVSAKNHAGVKSDEKEKECSLTSALNLHSQV